MAESAVSGDETDIEDKEEKRGCDYLGDEFCQGSEIDQVIEQSDYKRDNKNGQ